jgi:hypothetical protein
MDIEQVKNHIRNRPYMSGLERDKARVRSTGEVFTPTDLVLQYVDYCESQYPDAFIFPENTFCDNSCGDGQFLGEILIRKMERGQDFETALSGVFGVDYQQTNVDLCRERLLCGREDLRHIVEKNIHCNNSLTYGYTFNAMNESRRKAENKKRKIEQNKAKKLADQAKQQEQIKQNEAILRKVKISLK